jgi:hypothetical protein
MDKNPGTGRWRESIVIRTALSGTFQKLPHVIGTLCTYYAMSTKQVIVVYQFFFENESDRKATPKSCWNCIIEPQRCPILVERVSDALHALVHCALELHVHGENLRGTECSNLLQS